MSRAMFGLFGLAGILAMMPGANIPMAVDDYKERKVRNYTKAGKTYKPNGAKEVARRLKK